MKWMSKEEQMEFWELKEKSETKVKRARRDYCQDMKVIRNDGRNGHPDFHYRRRRKAHEIKMFAVAYNPQTRLDSKR